MARVYVVLDHRGSDCRVPIRQTDVVHMRNIIVKNTKRWIWFLFGFFLALMYTLAWSPFSFEEIPIMSYLKEYTSSEVT